MIALLTFSIIAALLVFLIGRKDSARDPRLTLTLLILLASYPLIWMLMPKLVVIPANPALPSGESMMLGPILTATWLTGTLVALLRLLASGLVLRQWRKQSELIEIIDGVEIRKLGKTTSPIATGVLRRIIYVPQTWQEQPEETHEIILAHELTHHRRMDPMWKWCAEIACAIHWFNPLVHWMARRLTLQCEIACDADVLKQGADQSRYALLLCDFASSERHPALTIGMASQSTLEQRVRRIMSPRHHPNLLVMVLCGLLGVSSALALSVMTTETRPETSPATHDTQLRLSADPFPGNP